MSKVCSGWSCDPGMGGAKGLYLCGEVETAWFNGGWVQGKTQVLHWVSGLMWKFQYKGLVTYLGTRVKIQPSINR